MMIGMDTNIVVRLLTLDDMEQSQKALRLFETEKIFISNTVLLETAWVLQYSYHFNVAQISMAFTQLIQLENVNVINKKQLEFVLTNYQNGIDFADAIHWINNQDYSYFLSFDRKFIKKSQQLSHNLILPKIDIL